jgi:hypothetical protein
MALSSFHPTVRRWFESRLGNPTLPQVAAVALVRKIRNRDESPLTVAAADPLNLRGILTPDERVSSHTQSWVSVL